MKSDCVSKRAAGVLLHISSLPGSYGIGTLGKEAYRFIDILHEKKIRYWQVLPLVQTSFGDSPYQSEYSGSGNPYFIDPEILLSKGLLTEEEVAGCVTENNEVDYGKLYYSKYAMLRKAFSRFNTDGAAFKKFVRTEKFEDYALFTAIKYVNGGSSFDKWEKPLRYADKSALEQFKKEYREEYLFRLFLQYEFFSEWKELKKYANKKGVKIIGDIPLYVAYDSADVWKNPALFKLDKNLKSKKVAGVPPDYFSATGQLWGNPVYKWSEHKKTNFEWWTDRFRRAFELYDVVRVDHFRGFDRYYEIGAGESTAVNGKWVAGPKNALFKAVKSSLGNPDIIAEDLGTLDEGVYRLLKTTGFPGMKVIEFAFDGNPDNPYLPHNITENSVCYTGTHDNDTLIGFVKSLDDGTKARLFGMIDKCLEECKNQAYGKNAEASAGNVVASATDEKSAAIAMTYIALESRANLTVVPVQDIMLTGSETRMNVPSSGEGNWRFRLKDFDIPAFDNFYNLCKKTGRTH